MIISYHIKLTEKKKKEQKEKKNQYFLNICTYLKYPFIFSCALLLFQTYKNI